MVSGWLIGAMLVATLTIASTAAGLSRRGWTTTHRFLTALGVGATSATVGSLLVQVGTMRGLSADQAGANGPRIGVVALMGGFLLCVGRWRTPRFPAGVPRHRRRSPARRSDLREEGRFPSPRTFVDAVTP